MKHLSLFTAIFVVGCASPGVPSEVPTPAASLEALPAEAPFRDEILRFAQLDRQSPPPACPVLFVGSSSIRLWTGLAEDMAPLPVLNRGFGGSSIADVNLYFDRIVAPYRPRAIVFYAGENDLDAGQAPEAVVAQFRGFLDRKRAALGDTPVFFISAKPSKLRFAQIERQSQLNAAIRTLAATSKDLTFVDVASRMMGGGEPRDLYVEDGLHMNAAGYVIWRDVVRQSLLERNVAARRCRN
jgi:lysophospholipase L1-like esterase